MYTTYILISSDGTHYIGSTDNIDRRLREHNSENGKKNRFTKKYSDWRVLYTESYPTLEESRKREKEIKSWK